MEARKREENQPFYVHDLQRHVKKKKNKVHYGYLNARERLQKAEAAHRASDYPEAYFWCDVCLRIDAENVTALAMKREIEEAASYAADCIKEAESQGYSLKEKREWLILAEDACPGYTRIRFLNEKNKILTDRVADYKRSAAQAARNGEHEVARMFLDNAEETDRKDTSVKAAKLRLPPAASEEQDIRPCLSGHRLSSKPWHVLDLPFLDDYKSDFSDHSSLTSYEESEMLFPRSRYSIDKWSEDIELPWHNYKAPIRDITEETEVTNARNQKSHNEDVEVYLFLISLPFAALALWILKYFL